MEDSFFIIYLENIVRRANRACYVVYLYIVFFLHIYIFFLFCKRQVENDFGVW